MYVYMALEMNECMYVSFYVIYMRKNKRSLKKFLFKVIYTFLSYMYFVFISCFYTLFLPS